MAIRITSEPIESKIIAYFDGKLSDNESAELLHRVSVSPEIRDLFQQHEALRGLAYRSARNVSVPASLEESLFARIRAMDREEKLPIGFWNLRRLSTAAGVAAILVLLFSSSLEFKNSTIGTTPSTPVSMIRASNNVASSAANNAAADNIVAHPVVIRDAIHSSRVLHANVTHSSDWTNLEPLSTEVAGTPIAESNSEDPATPISLSPAPRETNAAHINMPGVSNEPITSLISLAEKDDNSRFELGFASDAAEFAFPGEVTTSGQIFSSFALRGGYNFDAHDQVGMKVIGGTGFSSLQAVPVQVPGFLDVTRQFSNPFQYAGELFYKRRDPVIVNNRVFYITESVGAGMYSQGTLISGEAGIEIPIGDHLLSGISLQMNRLHQNQNNPAYSQPVIFEGPNIYNFLAGGIQYSLSYRF